MYLAHLSLTNFRNYSRLELPLSPGITVLTGDNAQGKSNLLEAVLFLATAKSFRAGNDRELINWLATGNEEERFARVAARLHRGSASVRLEVVIQERRGEEDRSAGSGDGAVREVARTASKRILVNGLPKRALDLIGQANAVMFSPADLQLVVGAPVWRRRYLDVTISQIDPRYVRTLAHYGKVLTQRNHLLRRIRDREATPDQLHFWDQELAHAGAYLLLQRLATADALNRLVRDLHRQLTDSRERLQIAYRSSLGDQGPAMESSRRAALGAEDSVNAAAAVFLQVLRLQQAREVAAGVSLFGPHRDDLGFVVDGREMAVYGSRGQQRTVALSLKLAEASFMRERSGDEPIVLLDDILSELDACRARSVVALLDEPRQVLITGTDLHSFSPAFLERAAHLKVVAGTISSAE